MGILTGTRPLPALRLEAPHQGLAGRPGSPSSCSPGEESCPFTLVFVVPSRTYPLLSLYLPFAWTRAGGGTQNKRKGDIYSMTCSRSYPSPIGLPKPEAASKGCRPPQQSTPRHHMYLKTQSSGSGVSLCLTCHCVPRRSPTVYSGQSGEQVPRASSLHEHPHPHLAGRAERRTLSRRQPSLASLKTEAFITV